MEEEIDQLFLPENTHQVEETKYAPFCLHAYPVLYDLYRDFRLLPNKVHTTMLFTGSSSFANAGHAPPSRDIIHKGQSSSIQTRLNRRIL